MDNLKSYGQNQNMYQLRANSICDALKKLIVKKVIPVADFMYKETGYKSGTVMPEIDDTFTLFKKDDRWGGHREQHAWFYKKINFEDCPPYRIELKVETQKSGWDASNPQFMLYVDGKIVQGMDTNHRTAVINARGEHDVHLYAYTSPEEDYLLELNCEILYIDEDVERLYYNISTPKDVMWFTESKKPEYNEIGYIVNKAINMLDMRDPNSEAFKTSVKKTNEFLEKEFYGKVCEPSDKRVACIGHTHIDIAWRWTVAQTYEKAQRSFATVCALMDRYPNYRFMSSQPILYKAVKEENPELYERIKQRVSEGRWDVEGASWVEMDCNLTSGESLVRQFLYGKRFFQREFGVDNKTLWLPDVFGYSAALPQILSKCGVENFVTSKIGWNDTNSMPYDTFWWKGIDGSKTLAHFITAQNINDSDYYNFNRQTTYVAKAEPNLIAGTYDRYLQKYIHNEALATIGFGDGGGGTTPYDCETVERLKHGLPGMPTANFRKVGEYMDEVHKSHENDPRTPVWQGELYLEFHRGTYTSQANNKKNNRKTEFLLSNAEAVSVTNNLLTGGKYDKENIYKHWETALTNQFHDIIPGSSIKDVYVQTDKEYAETLKFGKDLITGSLNAIAKGVKGKGVLVYNPNPFIYNGAICYDGKTYMVKGIPSKGYKVVSLEERTSKVKATERKLENAFYKVTFDKNYDIISVYDKKQGRELLKSGRKIAFKAYEDIPHVYDAWEISKYYTEKCYPVDDLVSHEIVRECNRTGIRITKKFITANIVDTVYLYDDEKLIGFEDNIDWDVEHVLLKREFPLDINADKATCEIQFGSAERSTHNNTSWDYAQFEVCAHKYVDVSEADYGVALINDCKYGHSIKNCDISLSLIKCATYPDPNADKGNHQIKYALHPHTGAVNVSDTANVAYVFNNPCYAVEAVGGGELPDEFSLISCDVDNVIIDTVKQAEDSEDIIVRAYEAKRMNKKATIKFGFEVKEVYVTDMLENELEVIPVKDNSVTLLFKPFEITTLKIKANK